MKDEDKDPVQLQLALKVCREDLTKAQEELTRIKAEYWDVVPQSSWDTLTLTHKQTLLQVVHQLYCTVSFFITFTVYPNRSISSPLSS